MINIVNIVNIDSSEQKKRATMAFTYNFIVMSFSITC
jgi:hypothetical protein